MAIPVVTFKGPLYPPSHVSGPTVDARVLAVKMAVSRAGFWPWQEFNNSYSNQFAHGIPKKGKRQSGVHGVKAFHDISFSGDVYDQWVHTALLKMRVPAGQPHTGEWAWNARARYLYQGFKDESEEERIVREIFQAWDILVRNEPYSHYTQARPIGPLFRKQDPPEFPNWLDCSGTVIYTCWLAGAKSPDPYGYSGYGNTNSLNDNGFYISRDQISKFCKTHLVCAFYGPSNWDTRHMVAVKSPNEIYSMGNEGGPEKKDSIDYWSRFLECRAYKVI